MVGYNNLSRLYQDKKEEDEKINLWIPHNKDLGTGSILSIDWKFSPLTFKAKEINGFADTSAFCFYIDETIFIFIITCFFI